MKTFLGERRLWPEIEGAAIFLYGPREWQQSCKKEKCKKWKSIFSFVNRDGQVSRAEKCPKLKQNFFSIFVGPLWSDLEEAKLFLFLLLGPLGLTANTVQIFTCHASQTHMTIHIPKAHDTYSYLIIVTGTMGGARVKIFCHV